MQTTSSSTQANHMSDYRHLFDKGQENLDRDCKEYQYGAIWQKTKTYTKNI